MGGGVPRFDIVATRIEVVSASRITTSSRPPVPTRETVVDVAVRAIIPTRPEKASKYYIFYFAV